MKRARKSSKHMAENLQGRHSTSVARLRSERASLRDLFVDEVQQVRNGD